MLPARVHQGVGEHPRVEYLSTRETRRPHRRGKFGQVKKTQSTSSDGALVRATCACIAIVGIALFPAQIHQGVGGHPRVEYLSDPRNPSSAPSGKVRASQEDKTHELRLGSCAGHLCLHCTCRHFPREHCSIDNVTWHLPRGTRPLGVRLHMAHMCFGICHREQMRRHFTRPVRGVAAASARSRLEVAPSRTHVCFAITHPWPS